MSRIYVVGFGPGKEEYMCRKARQVLEEADCIVGYTTYVRLIRDYFPEKEYLETPMRREVDRCRTAVEEAKKGRTIALISSGDAGIYGMAGILYEVAQEMGADVQIEVIPGITAATMAAAVLGAPLTHDFCVISLSDLLTPRELILKRIHLAAEGDFVLCIYNPRSRTRTDVFDEALAILREIKRGDTPVGIVRNAGRDGQEAVLTTLAECSGEQVDMFCTVIVGNSKTYVKEGKMLTPRGYVIREEDRMK